MSKRRKARATAKSRSRVKTRARRAADASTMTHRQLTEVFNALVPRANRLGIAWARHHTSAFESKALGARMLARLEEAIARVRD
jgi:hypothetical protein